MLGGLSKEQVTYEQTNLDHHRPYRMGAGCMERSAWKLSIGLGRMLRRIKLFRIIRGDCLATLAMIETAIFCIAPVGSIWICWLWWVENKEN